MEKPSIKWTKSWGVNNKWWEEQKHRDVKKKKQLAMLWLVKMQRKLFRNLRKLLRTKKVALSGLPTIKDKYSKNLKEKNDCQLGAKIRYK